MTPESLFVAMLVVPWVMGMAANRALHIGRWLTAIIEKRRR